MSEFQFQKGKTKTHRKKKQKRRSPSRSSSDQESKSDKEKHSAGAKARSSGRHEASKVSFDKLAEAQGWTTEQLRTCRDLERKFVSDEQPVRYPPHLFEDLFKNQEYNRNPDQEYNALETRFYNRLSNLSIRGSSRCGSATKQVSEQYHQPGAEKSTEPTTASKSTEHTTTTVSEPTHDEKDESHVRIKIANSSPSNKLKVNVDKSGGVDVSFVIPKKPKKK